MDPIKATEAACKYLRALYTIYGNWDLVLAAYNSGPGNVNKAIKRSGGSTNYWNIRSYLPRETANYVPAFQATMYIYQFAKDHGYKPGAVDFKRAATDTILVKNMIALERVAEFLDVDLETLQFLNPSYKLDIIPVIPGKTHWIRLPREAANTFVNKEEEAYTFSNPKREQQKEATDTATALSRESKNSTAVARRTEYSVRNGDYLGKIAARYDVGVSEIIAWNNLRGNSLKIGQTLYIHSKKSGTVPTKETKIPKTYTVKGGDSYWNIARKYGLTIAQIKKMNPQVTELKPGMKLRLS
jgi:membrane-bound lytic murein transglycosylase D